MGVGGPWQREKTSGVNLETEQGCVRCHNWRTDCRPTVCSLAPLAPGGPCTGVRGPRGPWQAGKHVSPYMHMLMYECTCASGNLRFAACVPSAWGSSGPRAGQLEAQSVEGSTAQWLEVGRTHNEAPTICPGIPSDQDVQLGRPSQGLTALHNPIHKTH
ncbi:hypothetical protein Q8A73_009750 [Channa argus]|nr:hypothetical protein Q8A73_009750 [Channa argus]